MPTVTPAQLAPYYRALLAGKHVRPRSVGARKELEALATPDAPWLYRDIHGAYALRDWHAENLRARAASLGIELGEEE